jgi:hypothetical protein
MKGKGQFRGSYSVDNVLGANRSQLLGTVGINKPAQQVQITKINKTNPESLCSRAHFSFLFIM